MAKQSNYNPDGNLVVRGNIVGDENIYITGNAVITGTLSVTGEATYSSDTVTQNAADGYVINSDSDNVPAYLQLNNSTSNVRLTYNTSGSLVVSKPTEFSENVTLAASKTLNAPTITDGTASITGGAGTGFTNITSTLFTGTVDGTATTAGNLQSDRTLTLTGPITGSVALGLNSNTSAPSIATTITNDSVTLGTHTVGNYVATVTGGTGLTSTVTTGENVNPTINLDDTAVTPGSYGTASGTGSFTVDQQGRLTAASTTAIAINSSQVTDFTTRVRGNISVTDSGGDGSLAYNSTSGVITYTGPSAAEVRAHLSSGTGIQYDSATGVISSFDAGIVHDNLSGFVANEHIDHSAVDIIAGTGLTGGGDITASRTLNVIGGDGITANANDIEVDNTVVRTSGTQSIAGDKTFSGSVDYTGTLIVPTVTLPSSSGGNYVAGDNSTKAASTAYVESAIDSLIDGAPGTLNTLNEIAAAINDDDNAYTTLTNSIATKVSKSGDTMSGALAMGTNRITGLGDPVNAQDAATQSYVGTSNAQMLAYVNTRDDTKVDKTETIASDSFYFALTNSNFGTNTSIDYSSTGGIKFTPIKTGSEKAILLQGNQTPEYTQKRHGDLAITGAVTIQPGIENNTSAPTSERGAGTLNVGGNTTFTSENKDVIIGASSIVAGKTYTIVSTGTTNFTLIGAADSNAGTSFIATGAGSGTGTVKQPTKTFLSNFTTAFFKQSIGTGESALYILGGNLYYNTKASEVDPYIVSDTSTSVSTSIGKHASDTSNTTLQAKSLGVERAHFQSFGNSTMFIGNIAHISNYTNVSYAGGTYTTGTRPLERLTIDGGVIMGPRTGDDELLVNGTIFFDDGVFKVIEGGIIKQVTTSSTSDLFFTGTATDRVAVGSQVSGDYYFPALGPDAVDSILISTAGNISANVTTLSANLDLVRNVARGNISTTGANISYDSATGVISSTVGSLTTADVTEGTNLYYTNERVDDRVNALLVGGANVTTTYDDAAGTLTIDADLQGDITGVTAGAGLTGGGTTGDVTLNVVGGSGITANANDISLTASGVSSGNYGSATAIPNITVDSFGRITNASTTSISYDNYGSWQFTTDSAGNETVSSSELVTFVGGNNMDVTHSGSTITIATNADMTGVIAGAGMTGGGTTGDVTLNVIGGDGITANANDIEVDNTVVRTSGTQSIAGDKTFTGTTRIDSLGINGAFDFPTADGSSNQVLATDGSGALSFQDVTAIGGTITGVTAGSGLTGGGVAGTVTVNAVGGYGITVNADNIEVANADIRGLFSAGGDLSYNSTTGVMSFTERTDAEVRGLISVSGDLSYDSSTGVISFTNDAGDIESVTAGTGLSGGGSSGDVSLALDFSELTDMSSGLTGNDEIILNLSSNVPRRKAANEINLSIFNLDNTHRQDIRGLFSAGGDLSYNSTTGEFSFTNDAGDIESVSITAGTGLTGTASATSGAFSTTLDVTGLTVNELAASSLQTSGESFADNDTSLMTSAAINDRIQSFNYSTTTGTVTSVSGGNGLTGSITTSGSLAVGAGTGITVNADSIEVDMGDFSTSDLSEGTNLYYTNARVDARITKSAIDALNVDADTVDSLHASSFLRSDAADSHTHTITPNADNSIDLGSTSLRYNEVHAVTFQGTASQAQYADLAENYVADSEYPVGTVLVLGGEEEVTVTDVPNSPKVAGVVSTDPAYLMNAGQSGQYVVSVALRGRVPVRAEGVVKKGDVLVTSGTPGVAMVGSDPHFIGAACIIGKAITSKLHGAEGIVEVLI